MTTTLITGANKGLGRETARRLIAAGQTVYLGVRDLDRGRRAADELGARLLVLDVVDDESIERAAAELARECDHLDVLINNAGIGGPAKHAGEMSAADVRDVYETNVFGVVRVTRAFLPLLHLAPHPRVINVSSGLGSLSFSADADQPAAVGPYLAYASSKAALNMLTVQYARAYPRLRVNAVNPGFTPTDINHFTGTQTLEQGTEALVRMATTETDGPNAAFLDAHGPVAW